MKSTLIYSIPLALGFAFATSAYAQSTNGECYAEDPNANAGECKPLTRAEVKVEVEKFGAATTGVGECPNIAAAPTEGGLIRTRAAVREEAMQAMAAGKTIDLGECPN
ncbi:MAG: hypothetical protein AB8C46_06490 [Burkholderiaceae bacterium]